LSRALIVGVACGLVASAVVAVASFRDPEGGGSPWGEPVASRQAAVAVAYAPPTYRRNQQQIVTLMAREARAQGVDPDVVLKLGYVESRYRNAVGPRTRHGRAIGPLQVLPGSAEALEPGSSRFLTNPVVGIRVGVRHIRRCMEAGAITGDEIARCHVAGWNGWNRVLSAGAERYKRQYVSLYRAAPAPENGWLARGEGSLNVASMN
jgi:hypothetical protein